MFCQNCGYDLGESRFCPMCGTKSATIEQTPIDNFNEEPIKTPSGPAVLKITEQTAAFEEVSKQAPESSLWRLLKKALSIIFSLLSVGLYAFSMLGFLGGGWEDALGVALVLLLPGFL